MTVSDGTCECGRACRQITGLAGRATVPSSTKTEHWSTGTASLPCCPAARVVDVQVTRTPHGTDVSLATTTECDRERPRRGRVDLMANAGTTDPQLTIRQVDALDRLWSPKPDHLQPL